MKKNKSLRRRILLLILTLLLALLAVLAIWQRNNLQALVHFFFHSQETLEEKIQQNDMTIKDAVSAVPDVSIRDITEEEKQAFRDGELTSEDLVDRLLGEETSDPSPTEPPSGAESSPPAEDSPAAAPEASPTAPSAPAPTPPKQESSSAGDGKAPEQTDDPSAGTEEDMYQQQLNALIARVYVLREEYLLALEQLEASAKADYSAMSPEERTLSRLAPVVQDYLSRGIALEAECDGKMDAIVAEMEALQKKYGKSMDLVKTVKYTYAEEKSLKKAWYMAELEERGLI